MSNNLIRFDLQLNDEELAIAQAILVKNIQYGWEEESLANTDTLVIVHIANAQVAQNLVQDLQSFGISYKQSEVLNQDWQAAWKDFFTPVEVENFVVLPTWLAQEAKAGFIPLVIEPKSAFGTGHHSTTVLCLKALAQILAQKAELHNFLDLGTGSGVLAIGAAKHGLRGLALDIDPLAVDNAKENLVINQVEKLVQVELAGVEYAQGQSYDLVLANILAGTLCQLAEQIIPLIKPNGYLVLSGILNIQAAKVAEAFESLGQPKIIEHEDWVALVYKKT